MRRLISAHELEEVFAEESIENVRVKSMGRRFVVVTFPNEEMRNEILKMRGLEIWFEELKPRNGEQASDERFV